MSVTVAVSPDAKNSTTQLDPRHELSVGGLTGEIASQLVVLLARAVVIARSGPDQPEPSSQIEEHSAGCLVVVLVLHLDSVELMIGRQRRDHLRGEDLLGSTDVLGRRRRRRRG